MAGNQVFSTDQPTEQALVARAQGGDDQALGTLLKTCGPLLETHLQGKIPERHQALLTSDDVIQETYHEAFKSLSTFTFRDAGSFLAWLRRVADSTLADAIRMLDAQKRGGGWNRLTPMNPDDSISRLFEALTQTTVASAAARKENAARLEEAISQLGPVYQAVVRGFDLHSREMESVAAELGRTVGAAYMIRARAHSKLRELLGSSGRYFARKT